MSSFLFSSFTVCIINTLQIINEIISKEWFQNIARFMDIYRQILSFLMSDPVYVYTRLLEIIYKITTRKKETLHL